MILLLLLLTTATVLVWAYLRWLKVKIYWLKRNVPHLPPNPIVGSLTFLQKENFATWMQKMYDNFKSPYVGFWLFWRPGLLINSPDIARNILVKDFGNFRNRFLSSGKTDPIGGLNLFTVNDPIWSSVRRHLSSIFTAAKLRSLQNFVCCKSKQLVQRIEKEGHRTTDLKNLYIDYTTDAIGTYAFGIETNTTLTGKGPLRDVTNEFGKFNFFRGLSWFSIFFFPELVDIFRFKFFSQSSEDYFKKIFHTLVKQTQFKNIDDNNSKNLLDVLLAIKKDKELTNEAFSEDLIISQAAIFLFAGFETTGTVLAYATYELAHDSEIQEKLYCELIEATKINGSDTFEAHDLAQLPYLNSIIKESLRKYPPMGWIDRIAETDYKVDDNLTIEAGTVVYINSAGLHKDPKFYPEPKKFDPVRFLPTNEKNIHPYSYLPFGEGPRICIGKRFGLMIARFALTSVFLNYEVVPVPNTPKPNDIKLDPRVLIHLPEKPLQVKFIPRKSNFKL